MIQTVFTPDVYTGTGLLDTYEFNWRILAKTDLIVLELDPDTDVVTELVLDSDFTVDDAFVDTADGGEIVLASVLADGHQLFIYRFTARTQLTNILDFGAFSTALMMKALDRLTMMVQELDEEMGRALKFRRASTTKDIDVPEPSNGAFLQWLNGILTNANLGDSHNEETITEGAETFNVVFDVPQGNTNYLILSLTASWATTLEWSDKLVTGFTVTFGTPAPAGGKLVWSVLSQ